MNDDQSPHLQDEDKIVWLVEDRSSYPYLREEVARVSRKDILGKKYYHKIGSLVGYVVLKPETKAIDTYYYRRYWWFKDKTGNPKPYDPYDTGSPGQGVKTSSIAVRTQSVHGRDF